MVEFLGTMAEWFQRNNDKNHITNEVKRRKTTRQSKAVMNNTEIQRKTTRKMNLSLDVKLDQPRL